MLPREIEVDSRICLEVQVIPYAVIIVHEKKVSW